MNYIGVSEEANTDSDFEDAVRGREFKGLGLTKQEILFVHLYIQSGGDEELAAVKAHYSRNHGYVLTKKLQILEAIRRYVLMEFQTDAVKAKKVLIEVMIDGKTPAMVKRQCAVDILNIANLAGGTLMPPGVESRTMDLSNLSELEKDILEDLLAKTYRDPEAESSVVEGNFTRKPNGENQYTGTDSDGE